MSAAGFSLDAFLDPLIRQAADDFDSSVPYLLKGAYRSLTDKLVKWSIDAAVKSLIERLIAEYLPSDRSQPFTGFALTRMTKDDAQTLEAAGLDPLTIIAIIGYAIQVIEWFRNRRPPVMAMSEEGPSVVDGYVVSAMLLLPGPSETLTIGEGPKADLSTNWH
jgi:hypothetical protein